MKKLQYINTIECYITKEMNKLQPLGVIWVTFLDKQIQIKRPTLCDFIWIKFIQQTAVSNQGSIVTLGDEGESSDREGI